MWAYVGTYTTSGSKGIYICDFDPASGRLEPTGKYVQEKNPNFLALHPDRRFLYAVGEMSDFVDNSSGAVMAFAIGVQSGGLSLLNRQSSHGNGPCHLSVDTTGRWVVVANYTSGSVALLPIRPDGSIGEATHCVQHEGSSINLRRQEGPHAHSIYFDPTNKYALSCDLGIDKVLIYKLDDERGKLVAAHRPFAPVKPGAGPRHLAFHPNGRFAYAINELDNTVTGFIWDAAHGTLSELQHISTLPEGYKEVSYCADIHIHPNGRFLYGSNRGHDSIAVFSIDETSGTLSLIHLEPTQGKFPRNLCLDTNADWLLAANELSDSIVTFHIDAETGKPTPTGHITQLPKPVCVVLLESVVRCALPA